MSFLRAVGALSVVVCLGVSARAQGLGEYYFGGAIGTAQNGDSTLHVRNPSAGTDASFSNVRWGIHPFEWTPYYDLRVGGWLKKSPHFGLELDFTHSKAVAFTDRPTTVSGTWNGQPISGTQTLSDHVQKVRFTNGVNILSLVPLYRAAAPTSRLQPVVGIGPSYFIIWSATEVDNDARHGRYHGAGWGFSALASLRYRLDRHLSLFAETRYTQGPGTGQAGAGGELRTTLHTWHEQLGLTYSF